MATYYSGTSGDVTFDGVTLNVTNWSFKDEATVAETTHKSGNGFYSSHAVKRKGSGSIEANYDGDINYGSPPCLIAGNTGSATLPLTSSSGSDMISGTILVLDCDYSHELDGFFKYTINFETQGSYSVPGE